MTTSFLLTSHKGQRAITLGETSPTQSLLERHTFDFRKSQGNKICARNDPEGWQKAEMPSARPVAGTHNKSNAAVKTRAKEELLFKRL